MAPSKLGLRRGQTITVKDAILALITKSANDVAVVVAEALGKTEINFAKMMTAKAKSLGMLKTRFRNASGLPNRRQISTARDMATLARRLIKDYPQFYYFLERSVSATSGGRIAITISYYAPTLTWTASRPVISVHPASISLRRQNGMDAD